MCMCGLNEPSMCETSSTPQPPTWQLLVEFFLPTVADYEQALRAQMALAMQAVALSPERRQQVQTAVTETFQHGLMRTERFLVTGPVLIRIYCSATPTATSASLTAEGASSTAPPAGSWGFFLIERLVSEDDARYYILELYLYEERG